MLLCQRASLEFSTFDPFPDTIWLPFRLFGRGPSRGTENVVWNDDDGDDARAFDYWFEERRSEDSVPVDRSLQLRPGRASVRVSPARRRAARHRGRRRAS